MRKKKFSQAFTMIELMTVIAVILILAGFVLGSGRKARIAAMEAKAKSMIAALEIAISMYESDTGGYPDDTSNATLVSALLADPGGSVSGWRGEYMEFKREDYQDKNPSTGIIVDPWGKAYRYAIMNPPPSGNVWGNTNSYNLWSIGSDDRNDSGDVGGDTSFGDDIYNW